MSTDELKIAYLYKGEILYNYFPPTFSNYTEIENAYRKALSLDEDNVDVMLSQCNFYMFWRNYLGLSERPDDEKYEDHRNARRTAAHVNALASFRRGTALLKQKIDTGKKADDLAQMGAFYLNTEMYDEAVNYYKEALATDSTYYKAQTGLGVAQSKLKNYDEAIRNFKIALSFDPDDLDVQSNLGDACLNAENFSSAESVYRKILQITAFHVDAQLGLANYFKQMADKALNDSDTSSAEEYFTQAIHQYHEVLENDEEYERMSRKLLPNDRNNIYYSLGYCKVKLYEVNRKFKINLPGIGDTQLGLDGARKNFEAVSSGDGNYFKAQNAIQRIRKEQMKTVLNRASYAGPALVILFALIMCVGAQILFFAGRPVPQQVYHFNRSAIAKIPKDTRLDTLVSSLGLITDEDFSGLNDFKNAVAELSDSTRAFSTLIKNGLIERKEIVTREYLGETSYAILTFGGMIFIVVGLFLRQITRFKMGSIELEKTTSDTISASPDLSVSKGL